MLDLTRSMTSWAHPMVDVVRPMITRTLIYFD